ncbi:MAG: DUF1573 domain-containing protein [Pirellulales bacterium]|nr:DUF1573 domain-containing protein [Pirellulales bacterium]
MAAPCAGDDWANKLFATRTHDFGTVARGAKAEYVFAMVNPLSEDVHVASVQVNCACASLRIEKPTLGPQEQGAIVASVNSKVFVGPLGSTITVKIDKPKPAEVQLFIKVNVYGDVLLDPASAALGTVARGTPAEKTLSVKYGGGSDWKILEVRSDSPHLTGTVTETARRATGVAYDLKVVLAKDAPVGYVNQYVWLVTNNPQAKQLPVLVEGQVQADVSVSPASLFWGVLQPGQNVTKRIVVRGTKPFRIKAIRADGEGFRASAPPGAEAKPLFVVPVTYTAGQKTGRIEQTIEVETDLEGTVLKVPAYAVVESPQ